MTPEEIAKEVLRLGELATAARVDGWPDVAEHALDWIQPMADFMGHCNPANMRILAEAFLKEPK